MTSGVHKAVRTRNLVFVDPGKHACAIAHWCGVEFRSATLIEGSRHDFVSYVVSLTPDLLVAECPVVYPRGSGKGEDPNDLIQVALSAGACMAACPQSVTVSPGEWKGQVPKEIHHRRIEPRLTERMRTNINAVRGVMRHNVLDAVALGLWWFDTHPIDGGAGA